MKLRNHSVNYEVLQDGTIDIFAYLSVCRQLELEGASLHVRNLESTERDFLKRVRRVYLDQGLAVGLCTVSTDFGQPAERQAQEFDKARAALRVALYLGAPALHLFAGKPPREEERAGAFERAVAGLRKICEEAAQEGIPVGLQNHNHGALCRTGDDVIRFLKAIDHPNLTFVLDTGQWAGSPGVRATPPADLQKVDILAHIRQTAALARSVRFKFYNPRKDGSEPFIDYDQVLDILRGVHYPGFIDLLYEQRAGEAPRTVMPRVVKFLRSKA